MYKFILAISLLLVYCQASTQTYNMTNNQVDSTCSGKFYDNGGASGYYSNSASIVHTFYSKNGKRIGMKFTNFGLYYSYDYLRIYDGPNTSYPIIGTYFGTNSPDSIISSGDALTFYFYSNYYDNYIGWEAKISCGGDILPKYNITNKEIDTVCNAVFYDDGGSHANYSDSKSPTHTFYAATGKYLTADFNMNATSFSTGDTLFVYDGADKTAPLLAECVYGSTIEKLQSSGKSLTFFFKSDASSNSQGWQAYLNCSNTARTPNEYNMSYGTRYVCDGNFYDNGGKSGNYSDGISRLQTFKSYSGDRISMKFTAFSLYYSYDYLRIYDGPNTNYPVIGTYYGTNSPDSIISSGDALTFYFYSSTYDNSSGWAAEINCGGTVLDYYRMTNKEIDTVCEATFYDDGGKYGNYYDSKTETHTFYAGTGKYLTADFNMNATSFSTGDTLFVYDGADKTAPLLGAFVAGSTIEKLQSSGKSITFFFKSDASSNAQGWQAYLKCTNKARTPNEYNMSAGTRYVCDGNFYDNGGKSGNYSDGITRLQTFKSYSGNRISMKFTSFNLYYSYDYLRIYDGPNTSYPIIGTYTSTNTPDTIISSGDALTFYFYSSTYDNSSGWAARINCGGPVLDYYVMTNKEVDAVCEAVFYDNGGSHNNYYDSKAPTHTFYASTGKYLTADFNMNATSFGSGDTLFVYDGADKTAPLLAEFVAGSTIEKLQSSGKYLTFYFKCDASSNAQGWQAYLNCTNKARTPNEYNMSYGTRYVCDGNFYDNGGKSGNYSDGITRLQTFKSYSGNRISMKFTSFSLYYSYDYLRIYDGPNTSYPLIGTYTSTNTPDTIISSGDALTFYFYSSTYDNSSGWAARINCGGPVLDYYVMTNKEIDTVCEAVFYDNGGSHKNYYDNKSPVHTFFASAGKYLTADFNMNATTLTSGDTLFVYDGADKTAPLLGAFVSGSTIEKLQSSGKYLTFYFKSDASSNTQGWQAFLNCTNTARTPNDFNMSYGTRYVCDGNFYDNGGKSGNYSDGLSLTQTFKSYSGNRISMKFTSFSLNYYYDYLRIYDGPNSSYPLIGTYNYVNSPDSIISSGDALTFYFYSSAYDNASGWAAEINCGGPVLDMYRMTNKAIDTVCNAMFYDNGGSHKNYLNSVNTYRTFCSDTSSKHINATFNANASSISSNDTLSIYDGPDKNSPLIAKHSWGSIFEKVQSSGQCLTFQFESDASTNDIGWQAHIECDTALLPSTEYRMSSGKRYICSGTFTDRGGKSGNYSDGESRTMTFVAASGDHLRMIFNTFRLYPSYDYLRIYDGPNASSPVIGTYYSSNSPDTVTSSGKALTFYFYSNSYDNSTGWEAEAECVSSPPTPKITSPAKYCLGDTLQLQATTISGVKYQWFGPSGFYSSSANPTINGLGYAHAGTYKLVVKKWGFVSDTAYLKISVNAVPTTPTVSTSGSSTFCQGDTLFLTSNYKYRNVWSNGDTSRILSVTKSGKYSLQYRSIQGCYSAKTSAISVIVKSSPSKPSIKASGATTFCSGDSVVLSSNYTYRNVWSNGDTTQSLTVKTSGNYWVYNVGINSCKSEKTQVTITVNKTPSAPTITKSGSLTFCSGDSLVLSSSYTVRNKWSTGDSTQKIIVKKSGTYSLYYTALNGCKSASTTVTATLSPKPATPKIKTSGSTTFCDGDTLWLSSDYKYRNHWSNNDTNTTIAVTRSGTYSLYYQSTKGCQSDVASVSVTVNKSPNQPKIGLSGATTFCEGGSVVLSSDYNYRNRWNSNDTTKAVLVTKSGTYQVTYTTPKGCSATSNPVTVTVYKTPKKPIVQISGKQKFCEGDSVQLTSYYTSGNRWSNGDTSQSVVLKSTQIITLFNRSFRGCSSDTVQFTILANKNPKPPVLTAFGSTTFCQGQTVKIGSSYAVRNSWNTADTNNAIIANKTGSYFSYYTNNMGCVSGKSNVISVTVNSVPNAPQITIAGDSALCNGDTITISSSYSSGNKWNTGSSQNSILVTNTGTYFVSYTNSDGCTSKNSRTVTITSKSRPGTPTITATGSTEFCFGDSVQLVSSGSGTISWSNGATGKTVNAKLSGIYTVTLIGSNGCTSYPSNAVEVTVHALPAAPKVLVLGKTEFCDGESLQLTSSYSDGNLWSNGKTGKTVTITKAGTYTVVYTDDNFCTSLPSKQVDATVLPKPDLPIITLIGKDLLDAGVDADNYEWYLSGKKLSFNSRIISAPVSGEYTVAALLNECYSDTSLPYKFISSSVSKLVQYGWSVYPNPTNDLVFVETNNEIIHTIVLMDASGKVLSTEQPVNNKYGLSLQNLPNGVYLLKIISANNTVSTTVIKQ